VGSSSFIYLYIVFYFETISLYYRAIFQLPSSSTYSPIQTLAAPSWLSLQTNFTKSLPLMTLQQATLSQSSLPPAPALTTSMAGLHESPRHLLRTCDFWFNLSVSLSFFVTKLCSARHNRLEPEEWN